MFFIFYTQNIHLSIPQMIAEDALTYKTSYAVFSK